MFVSSRAFSLLWQWNVGFWSGFGVKVLFQIFLGDYGLHAIGRNGCFRSPKDRVEHQLPLIVVGPALVKMAAGEAKATTAAGSLCCPRDVLRDLVRYILADIGIA